MLKRLLLASVLFSTTFAVASSSEAREWTIVGPRALGMGGAGVAVANDASASYWNPAAFGFFKDSTGGEYGKRTWSATLDAGFGAQVHEDLGEFVNRIAEADFSGIQSSTDLTNISGFIELVNDLKLFDANPDRALTISANGGLRAQVGHWGLAGYGFGDISARGDLDLVNIGPTPDPLDPTPAFTIAEITDPATYCGGACTPTDETYFSPSDEAALVTYLQSLGGAWAVDTNAADFVNIIETSVTQLPAGDQPTADELISMVQTAAPVIDAAASDGGGTGGTIDDNTSSLVFRGIAVAEVPLTYGRKINDDFAVGGNVKFMTAQVFNMNVLLNNVDDFGDALDQALDDSTTSTNFGIDLGALYRFGDRLRFGVVARNVNSPSFDMKPLAPGGADSLSEDIQVRAGVAYRPFSALLLAADIDVTENESAILSSASKSRVVSAGLEGNLFNFLQLRAGIYKNLSNDDIGPVFTAGLGLNLWAVNIDFGAAMSSGTTAVNGNDIPKEVRAEFALSTLF